MHDAAISSARLRDAASRIVFRTPLCPGTAGSRPGTADLSAATVR
jgi:hypothetical protein